MSYTPKAILTEAELYEPTSEDWNIVDTLWDRLQTMKPGKQRSIVTSLISACPVSIQAARNILADEGLV
jgi:hypothetical protein